ncbi:hypothetical protein BHR79_05165 [Methanohalophilus halophilus]|uniref:DNA (cytosine-5-)-methyltransferase n=1 Tax=Methanohalophilus halophilus TaxID=2177 RepID=A0A1L3Q4U4_9EURY|nr:hypothetical protein BHR79_05165 [Methanohalophilus halophilus]RNI07520.1 DNA cytosine methyltransferase [Methanohalophilus halophilus]
MVAVDLFCGAGGLTRGLLDAGIQVKKGYDIEERLKETYEKNNEGSEYHCTDIRKVSGNSLLQDIDLGNNYLLLAGCAPCQPFSSINKSTNDKDGRKILLLEFGRLIEEVRPDLIFVENVPGLKNGKGKYVLQQFEQILKNMGYHYIYETLNAKEFGVPQKRKRFILLASKHGNVDLPSPTHGPKSPGNRPYVTVRKAISKYPPVTAGGIYSKIPNHNAPNISEKNRMRLKQVTKDGGSRTDWSEDLELYCHKNHRGHTDVYGRMKWDDVAPTLTCKCTSISNGRFGHPTQTRAISVREAAAIQTFDDDYIFYGPMSVITKWVGNAVPVKFAKIFGSHFISHIGEIE